MFYLDNIPPGPAGSQEFDNVFSIDADGILTVTKIHVQTGVQHSLRLDSRSSGRMSTEEVNEVIARAEKLRKADEKETKRVLARTALETFSQELKFAFFGSQTDSKSQLLMDMAQECLDWLKENKEASEVTYQQQLKDLERESGKVFGVQSNSYGASNPELETCFSSGERCLRQSNIPGACQWFYKAYKKAGSNEKEKRYQAVMRLGQAIREYAHRESDSDEQIKKTKEKFMNNGAILLVFELKVGAMTTFCSELAAELGKLKDVFFEKVSTFIEYNSLCNFNI